jgi:hypothetical protein
MEMKVHAIQTKTVEIQVILIVFLLVILINGVHHTTQEHNSMVTTVTPLDVYNDSIDNSEFSSGNEFNNDSVETYLYLLPKPWEKLCRASEDLLVKHNGTGRYFNIECYLTGKNFLNFVSFRNFTSEIEANVLFSLSFICSNGGSLYFPYPGRARLLHSLLITGCTIFGYRAEKGDQSIDLIQDDMKYLVLNDSVLLTTTSAEVYDFLSPEQSSIAYECGPLNAIEITERHLWNSFENMTSFEFDLSEDVINEKVKDFHRHHFTTSYRCKYNNLRSLDKSFFFGADIQILIGQLQNSFYPEIELFNFSSIGIREIPVQFYEWRLLSKKLKHIDLTHNKISELGSFTCHDSPLENVTVGFIDLRYNNITYLKSRNLKSMFQEICDKFWIDIRENPFNCDCEMKDFIDFLSETNFTGKSRYEYLYDLKCFNPPSLRGKIIYQLSLEQLGCTILYTTILKTPIIVLCIIVFLFIVSLILCIRYRKEIIILAYTRLNILLPCQNVKAQENKKYDAFIAYSQSDINWVIYTLAKRLENPESGQRFTLCLHHRDFMVGAAISDNIVQSVESSRHTIIVVSKNFLSSEWCRLEFRVALHQSLLEKKRHLIIILLEDIPTSEFEPELKRCMQTLTYVKADDRWFWDKLVYALSDYSRQNKNKPSNVTESSESSTNKDYIKPSILTNNNLKQTPLANSECKLNVSTISV